MSMRRRPHDHHRDLRAQLPAALPTIDDNRRHQDRYVMTATTGLRLRRVDLASCWSSTGCHHARSTAPCGHQRKPATATLSGRPNHQSQLLLRACRVIARAAAHRALSRTPSASAKSPAKAAAPPPTTARGFVPWRLSDAGQRVRGSVDHRRHPKPCTQAVMPKHVVLSMARQCKVMSLTAWTRPPAVW